MDDCPCGKNCPNGCKDCSTGIGSEVCEGEIPIFEQCHFVWGAEESACKKDQAKKRDECLSACNNELCEDDCNEKYTNDLKKVLMNFEFKSEFYSDLTDTSEDSKLVHRRI